MEFKTEVSLSPTSVEERPLPTKQTDSSDSRDLLIFNDSWRLEEIEGAQAKEHCDDPLVEDDKAVQDEFHFKDTNRDGQTLDEELDRKTELDPKQVITEVREVLFKAIDRKLNLTEICKAVSKPRGMNKNEKDFRTSVSNIIKNNPGFIRMGYTTWKLAPSKHEESLDIDLNDILPVLEKLKLKSMHCGEYLIVMRSQFDVIISDEPYHALIVLFNLKSGKFMARIWNRSVVVGKATTVLDIKNACISHFAERRVCLGLLEDGHEQNKHKFLISQTPLSRKLSKTCTGFLSENAGADDHACSDCMGLNICSPEIGMKEEIGDEMQLSEGSVLDSENKENISIDPEPVNELHFEEELVGEISGIAQTEEKFTDGEGGEALKQSFEENTEVNEDHKCDNCDKLFKSKRSLRCHMKYMHSDNAETHSCPECGKEFSRKTNLNAHLKALHSAESETHTCPECGNEFSNKSNLNFHIANFHQLTDVHECKLCSFKSGKLSNFQRHMTSHSSERPFKCSKCEKAFKDKRTLWQHELLHNEEHKRFKCHFCEASFVTQSQCLYHTRMSHTGE